MNLIETQKVTVYSVDKNKLLSSVTDPLDPKFRTRMGLHVVVGGEGQPGAGFRRRTCVEQVLP